MCHKGELSPEQPPSPCREPAPSRRGPDSLVSVGSFPELVGSDPPREVEKAHGVLEVEVRDCCVLDKGAQSWSEYGQAGGTQIPEHKPLLWKLRAHEIKELVHRSEARTGGSGLQAWALPSALTLLGLDTLSLSRTQRASLRACNTQHCHRPCGSARASDRRSL